MTLKGNTPVIRRYSIWFSLMIRKKRDSKEDSDAFKAWRSFPSCSRWTLCIEELPDKVEAEHKAERHKACCIQGLVDSGYIGGRGKEGRIRVPGVYWGCDCCVVQSFSSHPASCRPLHTSGPPIAAPLIIKGIGRRWGASKILLTFWGYIHITTVIWVSWKTVL